jgi:endonuclease YncB( thermonuclease family)
MQPSIKVMLPIVGPRPTYWKGAFLAAIILLGVLNSATRFAQEVIGMASVIDADTLEIHGTRIRIFGIDAPESAQLCRGSDNLRYRCGAATANQLAAFLGRRKVRCLSSGRDAYGRHVAACSVDGIDVGEWLIRNGLALEWQLYSKRRYEQAQAEAHQAKRGIWTGSFAAPWRYRQCMKAGGTIADCSD